VTAGSHLHAAVDRNRCHPGSIEARGTREPVCDASPAWDERQAYELATAMQRLVAHSRRRMTGRAPTPASAAVPDVRGRARGEEVRRHHLGRLVARSASSV
jgi:hypothetical protein